MSLCQGEVGGSIPPVRKLFLHKPKNPFSLEVNINMLEYLMRI